jgi:hypothetical protein
VPDDGLRRNVSRRQRSRSRGPEDSTELRAPAGKEPVLRNLRLGLFGLLSLGRIWIASAAHQRVWPPVEKTLTTTKDYPVVLYDEV